MYLIFKKLLSVFLVMTLILVSPLSYAESSWSIDKVITKGSDAVVTASKNGYKSAVKIAPSAAKIGGHLLKGANYAALAFAVTEIIGDGIDWVVDDGAKVVKYKDESKRIYSMDGLSQAYYTLDDACNAFKAKRGLSDSYTCVLSGDTVQLLYPSGSVAGRYGYTRAITVDKTLSLSRVADQLLSNAKSGHAQSQQVVADVAKEMVVSGAVDDALVTSAVPGDQVSSDDDWFFSHGAGAVPGDQVATEVVSGSLGAVPGDQARDAADKAELSRSRAFDELESAKEAQRDAHDAADDLLNADLADADRSALESVKSAAADAAKAAAANAADAANAARDAANAARDAANAARDRSRAAKSDVINASAADAANARAAAEAANARAAKAEADAAKANARAEAAEKAAAEAAKAAAEAAKDRPKKPDPTPFELPEFCLWARPVCDAIDWLKKPESPDPVLIESDPLPEVDSDIDFGGQCPADVVLSFDIYNQDIDFPLMQYSKFCPILSTYIKPMLVLLGSFFAVTIVGGARESS